MELKEFVSGTIKQIIDGVIDAQEYGESKGAKVNPRMSIDTKTVLGLSHHLLGDYEYLQLVDFDVAVTSLEGEQHKGGIGIFVAPITLGAQGKFDYTNTIANRIKFTIPVMLPQK